MKLTNGQIKVALDALEQLIGPGNRLPVLAMLRADRSLRALAKAWAPCDAERLKLCQEYGKLTIDGARFEFPVKEDAQAFAAAYNAIVLEEVEVSGLEPVALKDIEAGYHKDQETGKKSATLDIDGTQLRALIVLGIIDDPAAAVPDATGPELVADPPAQAVS